MNDRGISDYPPYWKWNQQKCFSANLPRKTSTNSTTSSTSDVSCRSNPDVPFYSSNTNMSSQISSMFYGVVIHNKWWMCTQFSQMTKYPNNWAFECLTSLLNTFPWISSVCWDKWLIFLFSLLYLVYLKHARIVYTCMCVLLSHVYKLCGSYLNTPAVVTRQIYTPVCHTKVDACNYMVLFYLFFFNIN